MCSTQHESVVCHDQMSVKHKLCELHICVVYKNIDYAVRTHHESVVERRKDMRDSKNMLAFALICGSILRTIIGGLSLCGFLFLRLSKVKQGEKHKVFGR